LGPRRRRQFPALRRRVGNVGFWVFNLVVTAFLLSPPYIARAQIEALLGFTLPSWPIGNPTLATIAGFLLLDLMRYAVHRLEHVVPLLWRFHALHHSDPDVDVTTAVRHHPIEYVAASVVYWLAVLAFDIPPAVVLVHGLAVFAAAAVQHGNIRLPEAAERWLQPALVTTDMHRIHHSTVSAEADANYGAVLSIWDRLFGTYLRRSWSEHNQIVFGVGSLTPRECLRPLAMIQTPWVLSRARSAE
jgi:sterol desaturase/sphingolipid hydroxylase (fatty acid hydroxylase superfamily)